MRWFSLIVAACFLSSCSSKKNAPDVSDINIDVKVLRFEKDFFAIDTTQLQSSLQAVEQKYPAFLAVYFKYFAPVSEIAQQQNIPFETALTQYIRFIKPLAVEAEKKFPSLASIEKELETNLRYVKHYFPSFRSPVVLTSVESLNPENPNEVYGTTFYHDTLIISLQTFLGKDYAAYDPTQYPDYIRRRFEPAYILPNSIRAIVGELYPDSSQAASLIEQMIEKGKQWWLMKKLLPETPDSLITGYTAQQTKDLQREEGNIWGVITQNENLYSVEQVSIQTYIGEAPFTPTLPQGAPGNIGPWIGWRIVQKFEEENPKLTVDQILHTTAKKIFQESKYKPK
ncbi:MAG: hypothetical protein EOO10_02250 [Chitinophagaceae bacterium]|nr:MAG: hypothetical protein EOO10_02250 [Chitinophagaceae bacterium]